MKRIVITGSAGSGKTTLIEELSRRGFQCFPEASRELISRLIQEDSPNLPWRNREAFQNIIIPKRIELFQQARKGFNFYDRGIPDEDAYYLKDDVTPSELCNSACKNYKYDIVFLLSPWFQIFKNDEVRQETFIEACMVYDFIVGSYLKYGYNPIVVPKTSVKERANFILETIYAVARI